MRRLNLTSVHAKECRLHPSSDAAKKREELNGLDYREGGQNLDKNAAQCSKEGSYKSIYNSPRPSINKLWT